MAPPGGRGPDHTAARSFVGVADEPGGACHDVIIVGSGPAGYTAAIYAARAQLDTVVMEGTSPGGALMTTTVVENYPGFSAGITGSRLIDQMRAKANRSGAHLQGDDVDAVELHREVKAVVAAGKVWHARAVILAMGSAPRNLNVPGEQLLYGRGVSTTAKGDGLGLRDQDVAVVGGGDAALEEALFLSSVARSVTIIHHRNTFRSSAIMTNRARVHDKIAVLTDTEVIAVQGARRVTGLRVRELIAGAERNLPVTAVIVAVGHGPRSELLVGLLDLDSRGYVLTRDGTAHTSVDGVFAAGDLVDRRYRQAVTAAASGCVAALDAERWLAQIGSDKQCFAGSSR
ncbi:MAG TPA: FAD-dependent oxidoreductase [Mycobacterium sp.]|nr:FAD-dependent oxidoreductase [Mycobacterium sp.]